MLKKRIIKGIILIVIGFIIYLGNCGGCDAATEFINSYYQEAFTKAQQNGGLDLQYVSYLNYEGSSTEDMFFCNKLGYPPILINKLNNELTVGSPDVTRVTSRDKTDTVNPQIAYALSIGILPKNLNPGASHEDWYYLQNLIWDANPDEGDPYQDGAIDSILNPGSKWGESIGAETPIEVQRFRRVYEEIFEKTLIKGDPLFRIEDKQASLFVDQNDGTYIYGPFQLKVNCDASQEVIDFLIMEIMEEGHEQYIDYDKGEAYIESYYKLHKSIDENFINNGISDGSKKKLRYDIVRENKDHDSYSTILVDENGKPIDFPKVTQTDDHTNNFFIKFYPANGGSIINLGNGETDGELFNLKVKYGSYLNYKEHIQQAAFYTKGVIGTLDISTDDDLLIKPGTAATVYKDDDVAMTDPNDTGVHIKWTRLDNPSEPILWKSYLGTLFAPLQLAVYNKDAGGSGSFLRVSNKYATFDTQWDRKQNYYYLDNYYASLKCVGFTTSYKMDKKGGATITIPFGFAGDTDVALTNLTKAIKYNYGFPVYKNLYLDGYYGIVKEKATATYTASGSKTVVDEPAVYENGVLVQAAVTHTETDNWSTTRTIYRYRLRSVPVEEIIANSNNISSGASPVYTEGTNYPARTTPTPPSNSYTYGNVSESIGSWSIDTIYGENTNTTGENSDAVAFQHGFRYKTNDEGWTYDRQFLTYDGRVSIGTATGKSHEYTFEAGKANGEYDIWIPRDVDNWIPGSQWEYEEYAETTAEMTTIRGQIQSFVSFDFEGEGDIYKYGTNIAIERVALPHLKIAEAFGGNIWKESVGPKGILEKDVDGIYHIGTDKGDDLTEEAYRGVKVDLYECDINYKEPQQDLTITDDDVLPGRYLTSTFTDQNGEYRFYGKIADNTPLINPLKKYYVKFVYNGQIYAQTLYNVAVGSEYGEYNNKTSKGLDENRPAFNSRFENIYSDSNNYTYAGQRYAGCNGTLTQEYTHTGRAYGLKHVVQEARDNLANDPSARPEMDTFEEQYNYFIKNNTHADVVTTPAEYQFKHAGSPDLKTPIDDEDGEIDASDIDKYWEYRPGEIIDYNYNGLSPSVREYLKDCMIEASVPYTPDLDVYGRNIGETDLHQKFPTQATFNLKDMTRVYENHYRKWEIKGHAARFKKEDVLPGETTRIDPPPQEIQDLIGNVELPEGTIVTLFEYGGQKFYHIDYSKVSENQSVKVASVDDIQLDGQPAKVAGIPVNNLVNRNDPSEGPVGPDDPPGPTQEYVTLWCVEWVLLGFDDVHTIDHFYEPPREDYINLYNKEFDLRHCWSFGVYQRANNQVELEKDLYKTTLVVNGKKEVYSYSSKLPNDPEDNYNLDDDQLININKPLDGGEPYIGEIRKSDYLYDENISYGNGQYSKNIQAYLTYKIVVRNKGSYSVRINEIADYYDADNLEFDGVRDQNGNLLVDGNGKYQIATHTQYDEDQNITKSKYTYVTDNNDEMGHDVNTEYIGIYNKSAYTHDNNGQLDEVSETFEIENKDADNNGQPYHLKSLYIRGVEGKGVPVLTKKSGVTYELIPNQKTILFVTFRVKNNTIDNNIATFTNQIKLDQITRDFVNELPTIGKNNFAEINSYASYYAADVPSDAQGVEKEHYRPYSTGKIRYSNGKATYLTINNREVGDVPENEYPMIRIAGLVDVYSNPGSFDSRDVEVVYTNNNKYKTMQFVKNTRTIVRPYGSMINKADPYEETLPAVEPDMDKAPAIRLILDDDQIRKISGYVFEDARNVNSDGSRIGDGEFGEGDTPINGVTVQLVELIQDVDYDGTFTGQYIGEKVWDECEYTGDTNGPKYQLKANSQNQGVQYYSGKGVEYPDQGIKYILNSTSNLTRIYTDPSVANEPMENGKYCFAGLPSGDFIVRFIYGDTDRTVLTDGSLNNPDEITGHIQETSAVNQLVGSKGLNVKSYNGQDYKSTVYQRKLNNNSSTNYQVNQDAISYKMKGENTVKGYVDTVNQDYASTNNYNSNELRTKEQLYDNDVIYYKGQPINNTGDLTTAGDAGRTDPRENINNSYGSMWRYDRVATNDKLNLSDANDLYGYRQRGIDYAQGYTTGVSETDKTLLNYRAEVLSSFERVTSQEYYNGTTNAEAQKAMIQELTENTYMVAQTGIISMNEEYEGIENTDSHVGDGDTDNLTTLHRITDGKTHENHARQVDLGLVERPKAQVKLVKEVSNLEIKLADGQTLFNANTAMKDLIFDDHNEHIINYANNTLEDVRVGLNTKRSQETIQASMDDEIMNGATINVTYNLKVENVGEIDYQDRDFYYYGRKSAATSEPVRTKVVRVIDYVPNDLSYDASKQNSDAHWDVYEPNELIQSRIKGTDKANIKISDIEDTQDFKDDRAETYDEITTTNGTYNGKIYKIEPRNANGSFYDKVNRDYVSRTYAHEVGTYNTIVVTKDMNDNLLPTLYGQGQNEDNTTLILTTSITSSGNSEALTYNNLAEVIETSNSYGRRMAFSISGNQEMANQDINDAGSYQDHHAFSSSKITQPREIDADSAQKVQILPPTGSQDYRNQVLAIITTVIATIIVLVGAIIIKKKVYNK